MINRTQLRISDIGEKRLISEFVSPLFNSENEITGVGDDCAMVPCGDEYMLLSTDRVPADLISFRLGLINYSGLGAYLANLNLSDIAACGGMPIGILLNLGLPNSMLFDDLKDLCSGALGAVVAQSAKVLGGDLSSSSELSISATSFGRVLQNEVLTRRGARPGDIVFASRPLGLTPAAFAYFLELRPRGFRVSDSEEDELKEQFGLPPLVALGRALATSGHCTACMDNTDGIGQTLSELSALSGVGIVIDYESVSIPAVVEKIARELQVDPIQLAFRAGADFSLVGTLCEHYTVLSTNSNVQAIGVCEEATGLFLRKRSTITALQVDGWNYYCSNTSSELGQQDADH